MFYSLCAGVPQALRDRVSLGKPDDFLYLSGCSQYFANTTTEKQIPDARKSDDHLNEGALSDPIVDDFVQTIQTSSLDEALSQLGLREEDKRDDIYSLVAAVLHLGNIKFESVSEDARDACRVTKSSEESY